VSPRTSFFKIFILPAALIREPAKEAEMRAQSLFKTSPDGGIYPPLSPKAFSVKFKSALQKRLLAL